MPSGRLGPLVVAGLVGAALVSFPLAANAGPDTSIASDGFDVSAVEIDGAATVRSHRGDGGDDGGGRAPGPLAGGNSAESIIGPDTRKRVTRTTKFPFSAIAIVYFNGGWWCTGWFISADTVATAGDCVHKGRGGKNGFYAVSSYTIFPGANGTSTPYGQCGATRLYTVNGWARKGKDQYNYGAIKLDCTVGDQTGWLGLFRKRGSMTGLSATVAGYPDDKAAGTMWKAKGKIAVTRSRLLFYKIDTDDNQSGSPVYFKHKRCGWCAMAVNTSGTSGSSPPFSNNNHGTRITKAALKNFKKWRK